MQPADLARAWHEADADARRGMIVATAMSVLDEMGIGALSMRAVAHRLQVGTMTLYTYIEGQDGLHRAIVVACFRLLHTNCIQRSTLETEEKWRGGSRAYLLFAINHPNLYKLMFDVPNPRGQEDRQILRGGLEPLLARVTERLAGDGPVTEAIRKQALALAGRYWIALHGLASLAIAGRLEVLEEDTLVILDRLLDAVAPI